MWEGMGGEVIVRGGRGRRLESTIRFRRGVRTLGKCLEGTMGRFAREGIGLASKAHRRGIRTISCASAGCGCDGTGGMASRILSGAMPEL